MQTKTLKKFVRLVTDRMSGDWILIGGSLLPLLGVSTRFTEDIDIVAHKKATQRDMLQLMEIAEKLGLPVESVNQAASFFLHRIPNWEKNLILLYRGKRGSLWRPNATLYLLLKIRRFTEADLLDCERMIEFAFRSKEPIDFKRLLPRIKEEMTRSANSPKASRLKRLLHCL